MFICDGCLKKRFANEPSIFRSRGPCEVCEKLKECSDIPSSLLRDRPKSNPKLH